MKEFFKKNLCLFIIIFLLLVIIGVLIFDIEFKNITNDDFEMLINISALIVSVVAIVVAIMTHYAIVKRDKKIHTVSELSRIRAKYPNLYSCQTAKCGTRKELCDMRLQYLREMEFFCIGLRENIYDIEIVRKMSGHLLSKQYEDYMCKYAYRRVKKGFEYKAYREVMENLCDYYKKVNGGNLK